MSDRRNPTAVARALSLGASAVTALAGAAVLIGWALDIPLLKAPHPSLVSMKANTAACFALLGAAIALLQPGRGRGPRRLGWSATAVVTLVGLLTVSEYALGVDLGLDQALFSEPAGAVLTVHPGRMAPATAVNFVLAGLALLLLDARPRRGIRPFQVLIGLEGVLSLAALVGYVYGAAELYGPGTATPMAVHTSVVFLFVFFAVAFARPEAGLVAVASFSGLPGAMARRLLLAVLVVPIGLDVLFMAGARVGLYGASYASALHVTVLVAAFVVLIAYTASSFEQSELVRLRGEATLSQEKAFSDAMVESLPGVFCLIDQHGRFLRWNRNLEAVTGYSGEEIAAANPLDFFCGEDKALIEARIGEIFTTDQVSTAEASLAAKDGTSTPCFFTGIRVVLGGEPYLIGLAVDISERRAAERALRESEEALALQGRIAAIFLTVDDDEMFNEVLKVILDVMHSPFGVFGYLDEAGALVVPTMTRQIWDKCEVPEKDFVFPRATWGDSSWPRAIREKKANYSNEVSTKAPEGHVTVTRHISLPILFQNEVIGLFQVANKETDYTEADTRRLEAIALQIAPLLDARLRRERAQEALRKLNAELEQRVQDRTGQLEAANRELEAFSYSVSHDLRAPLRAIDGFSKILLNEHSDALSSDGQRYLKLVRQSSQDMGRLIDDLLAFSRLSRQPLAREHVDTAGLVATAVAGLQAEIEGRNVTIDFGDLPRCEGDPGLLTQVFANLLSNAIKFTRPRDPALIEVGFLDHGGVEAYFVRDNGVGFDMRYKGRLFHVFQRLHRAEEFEGTGVGLAIVERIVKRHGGRVWAEAEPDKGATFFFSLRASGSGVGGDGVAP